MDSAGGRRRRRRARRRASDLASRFGPAAPTGPGNSQHGSLLGPRYGDEEIVHALDEAGARYQLCVDEDDTLTRTADLLAAGRVVGWFQDRMEFGPRALGARSILADPRSATMQATMNVKIKFRESFRPFAPAVLEEDAKEYFDLDKPSPYMLLVADVVEKHRRPISEQDRASMAADPDLRTRLNVARSDIPAVTHVDYSARVQTVSEARNGIFYRLLDRFKQKTGCPVLVNTSFNIRGEPIVCTPADAYRCFLGTNMDALVIGNCILLKDEQVTAVDADSYRKNSRSTDMRRLTKPMLVALYPLFMLARLLNVLLGRDKLRLRGSAATYWIERRGRAETATYFSNRCASSSSTPVQQGRWHRR